MDDCEAGKERAGAAERSQESGAAAVGCRGHRKTAAVLRLLQREDLETVSRSLGVTPTTLTTWRDAFPAAGAAALATRPESGEALENERLKAKLGEVMVERDLLHEKIAVLEAGRSLGFGTVETAAMSGGVSPVTGRAYGLAVVCRA